MKGCVYLGDAKVEVREFPKPAPGPGEALIEMKAAGLCGSDLHKYHKDRSWADAREGMISGHEPAGVVAELGPGVEGLQIGDRVSVYHSLGCGRCPYCLSGAPVFCEHEGAFGRTRDGSHADFMLAPARHCLPLPDDFSFATGAALACTACTAFSAIRKLPLRGDDTLVVFGLGPVGLGAALMGLACGVRTIGVELNPYRLDLARRLGCEELVDAASDDAAEAILDLTHGKGADRIIECSGSAAARRQTAACAARHAHIVIVGAGADEVPFDQTHVILKELTIRGNAVFPMSLYFEAVEFLRLRRVPLDDMITHRFRIEQAAEAFALFDTGRTGKVIFEWPE